jgi:hypothetical protein
MYDGGFGNPKRAGKENHVEVTGEPGRQYLSSGLKDSDLNKALSFSVDELLKDIPQ